MKKTDRFSAIEVNLRTGRMVWFLLLLVGATVLCAEDVQENRFEGRIQRFEAADAEAMPPEGAIVAVGSSSMTMWNELIQEDLAPLTIIPRGFGGSTFGDAIHFAKRIVTRYKPRAVLVYEGDNDIALKMTPEAVRDDFVRFVEVVREALPDVRIYVVSIKPSIARIEMWEDMKAANGLIEKVCSTDEGLTFIDGGKEMMGADGTPLPTIFKEDKLHMNRSGYAIWKKAIGPVLMAGELEYEKK